MKENEKPKIHYTVLTDLYKELANRPDLDEEATVHKIKAASDKILASLDTLSDEKGNLNTGDVVVGLTNALASIVCSCTAKGQEDVLFWFVSRVVDTFKKRCVEIGLAIDDPSAVIPLNEE